MISIAVSIVALIAAIGSALGVAYTVVRTLIDSCLRIEVNYEIIPKRVKTLKVVTIEGKVDAKVWVPMWPMGLPLSIEYPVPVIIRGGNVRVQAAGQVLGTSVIGTDGKFSVAGPIILNPGRVPLIININNLNCTLWGVAWTQRDLVIRDDLIIEKPTIKVQLKTPQVVYSGKTVTIKGVVTLDDKTPQEYSPYISEGQVTVVYNGKKTTGKVDPQTGEFYVQVKFDEPRNYDLIVDVLAFSTFAYVGLWTQISVGVTYTFSATATPPPLTITRIEPERIIEGSAIRVYVEATPNKEIILEWDDTKVDSAWTDEQGRCVLTVPSTKVKSGTHIIKVSFSEKPRISISKVVEVLEKVGVKFYVEAPSATFRYGGIYEANIDTIKENKYVPHRVVWRLGTIQKGEYNCETGASTLRLVFPKQRYSTYYVLTLSITVYADSEMYIKQTTIRIGYSTYK